MTMAVIQSHSCMRKQTLLRSFHEYLSVDLDRNQWAATNVGLLKLMLKSIRTIRIQEGEPYLIDRMKQTFNAGLRSYAYEPMFISPPPPPHPQHTHLVWW